MRHVDLLEANAQLSKWVEEVEAGEKIVIAREGKPVAVLTAFEGAAPARRLGLFSGQAQMQDDFDVLPEDMARVLAGQMP